MATIGLICCVAAYVLQNLDQLKARTLSSSSLVRTQSSSSLDSNLTGLPQSGISTEPKNANKSHEVMNVTETEKSIAGSDSGFQGSKDSKTLELSRTNTESEEKENPDDSLSTEKVPQPSKSIHTTNSAEILPKANVETTEKEEPKPSTQQTSGKPDAKLNSSKRESGPIPEGTSGNQGAKLDSSEGDSKANNDTVHAENEGDDTKASKLQSVQDSEQSNNEELNLESKVNQDRDPGKAKKAGRVSVAERGSIFGGKAMKKTANKTKSVKEETPLQSTAKSEKEHGGVNEKNSTSHSEEQSYVESETLKSTDHKVPSRQQHMHQKENDPGKMAYGRALKKNQYEVAAKAARGELLEAKDPASKPRSCNNSNQGTRLTLKDDSHGSTEERPQLSINASTDLSGKQLSAEKSQKEEALEKLDRTLNREFHSPTAQRSAIGQASGTELNEQHSGETKKDGKLDAMYKFIEGNFGNPALADMHVPDSVLRINLKKALGMGEYVGEMKQELIKLDSEIEQKSEQLSERTRALLGQYEKIFDEIKRNREERHTDISHDTLERRRDFEKQRSELQEKIKEVYSERQQLVEEVLHSVYRLSPEPPRGTDDLNEDNELSSDDSVNESSDEEAKVSNYYAGQENSDSNVHYVVAASRRNGQRTTPISSGKTYASGVFQSKQALSGSPESSSPMETRHNLPVNWRQSDYYRRHSPSPGHPSRASPSKVFNTPGSPKSFGGRDRIPLEEGHLQNEFQNIQALLQEVATKSPASHIQTSQSAENHRQEQTEHDFASVKDRRRFLKFKKRVLQSTQTPRRPEDIGSRLHASSTQASRARAKKRY